MLKECQESNASGDDDSGEGESKPKTKASVPFEEMARRVSAKWKIVDKESKRKYELLAAKDMERYNQEMVIWKQKKKRNDGSSKKCSDKNKKKRINGGRIKYPRRMP